MSNINNLGSGNFVATGVYIDDNDAAIIVPTADQDNNVVVVGCLTDGPVGQPIYASTAATGSPGPLFAAVGAGTTIPFSGVRAAITMMPDITEFIFVRVTDGNEVNAVVSLLDTDGNPLLLLVANNPGTNANGMTARVDIQASDINTSPVFQITIAYPYGSVQTLGGIIGYATAGQGFDAPTFIANAQARVNGVAGVAIAWSYGVASPGSGTAQPQLATVFVGSGGADGTDNMTANLLQGVAASSGGTGIYAVSGIAFGGLVFGNGATDLSVWQNVAAFLEGRPQGGMAFASLPSSLTLEEAQAEQAANSVFSRRVVLCSDWDYVNDVASGQSDMLVDPAAAIASIVISQDAWDDPANKPYTGKLGILGTERSETNPVDPYGEGGQREASGIMWLTNTPPRGGNFWCLPHGQASDGSNISDTRSYDYVASLARKTLGKFVGEGQTPLPTSGPDLDATRRRAKAALNSAYLPEVSGSDPHFAAISVTINVTNTGISQGFLRYDINVTTKAGVKFALGVLAVGTTVQIISADAVTAAAAAA